jgi:hypothetical protein
MIISVRLLVVKSFLTGLVTREADGLSRRVLMEPLDECPSPFVVSVRLFSCYSEKNTLAYEIIFECGRGIS